MQKGRNNMKSLIAVTIIAVLVIGGVFLLKGKDIKSMYQKTNNDSALVTDQETANGSADFEDDDEVSKKMKEIEDLVNSAVSTEDINLEEQ